MRWAWACAVLRYAVTDSACVPARRRTGHPSHLTPAYYVDAPTIPRTTPTLTPIASPRGPRPPRPGIPPTADTVPKSRGETTRPKRPRQSRRWDYRHDTWPLLFLCVCMFLEFVGFSLIFLVVVFFFSRCFQWSFFLPSLPSLRSCCLSIFHFVNCSCCRHVISPRPLCLSASFVSGSGTEGSSRGRAASGLLQRPPTARPAPRHGRRARVVASTVLKKQQRVWARQWPKCCSNDSSSNSKDPPRQQHTHRV